MGFAMQRVGLWVSGFGIWVSGFGFRVSGFGVREKEGGGWGGGDLIDSHDHSHLVEANLHLHLPILSG